MSKTLFTILTLLHHISGQLTGGNTASAIPPIQPTQLKGNALTIDPIDPAVFATRVQSGVRFCDEPTCQFSCPDANGFPCAGDYECGPNSLMCQFSCDSEDACPSGNKIRFISQALVQSQVDCICENCCKGIRIHVGAMPHVPALLSYGSLLLRCAGTKGCAELGITCKGPVNCFIYAEPNQGGGPSLAGSTNICQVDAGHTCSMNCGIDEVGMTTSKPFHLSCENNIAGCVAANPLSPVTGDCSCSGDCTVDAVRSYGVLRTSAYGAPKDFVRKTLPSLMGIGGL